MSSFKAPSAQELGHDYLWRHARRLPARGQIGIFNRSPLRGGPGSPGAPGEPGPPEAPPRAKGPLIAATLIEIGPRYLVLDEATQRELQRAKAELEAEAPPGAPADPAAAKPRT